jgi:hypothetical protein
MMVEMIRTRVWLGNVEDIEPAVDTEFKLGLNSEQEIVLDSDECEIVINTEDLFKAVSKFSFKYMPKEED